MPDLKWWQRTTAGAATGVGTFRPEDYGAKGDCKTITDAAIATGTTALTAPSGPFQATDVGKWIGLRGAGLIAQGSYFVGQITGYTSPTAVTLSAAAAQTVNGAVCTFGTDDTAAIRAAVNAAVAWGLAHSYWARVLLSTEYLLSAAPVLGGATAGNAQIPLPVIPTTGKKFVLSIEGPVDGSGFYHWNETVPQAVGGALHSLLVGQTADGTYSLPSVIGGPTSLPSDQGTPGFSNMLVAIDGVTVVCPHNPSYLGVDLGLCAQANIGTLSCVADGLPASSGLAPTNDNGIGLRMPKYGNNDNCNVFAYSCEGFYYGASIADHFTAQRLGLVYCNTAIFIAAPRSSPEHGAFIGYASIEACVTGIFAAAAGGGKYPMFVARMDCEVTGGGFTVDDAGSVLFGELRYAHNLSNSPTVNNAANLRIVDDNRARGQVAAPGLPATTVALANPFFRDAAVHVAGGTVTAITVDGQAVGVTAGLVIVPSGKTIAVTNSLSPTWKCTLL